MFLLNKHILFKISLYGFFLLFLYSGIFLVHSFYTQYKLAQINSQIESNLRLKKLENKNLSQRNKRLSIKIKSIKASYLTQKELEEKITGIYERMSLLNYNISLIKSQKMCINHYILVNQVSANTKEGTKEAFELLSFLGTTKQSSSNESIYFLDLVLDRSHK